MDSSTLNSSDEKNIGLYNQNEDAIRKRLLRRVDWNVVGILVFIYAVNFLDRVAVGQAKLEGMLEDINVVSDEVIFDICLTLYPVR